jgi:hypothetical protein
MNNTNRLCNARAPQTHEICSRSLSDVQSNDRINPDGALLKDAFTFAAKGATSECSVDQTVSLSQAHFRIEGSQ